MNIQHLFVCLDSSDFFLKPIGRLAIIKKEIVQGKLRFKGKLNEEDLI